MTAVKHEDGICRCSWCGTDPLYVHYHDTDWGVPEYDSRALFEKLILDGFQAGLSWITILRKRENFRKAFDGFKPEIIARYDHKKIEIYLTMPDFSGYLWGFIDGKPIQNQFMSMKQVPTATPVAEKISKDLKKRGFKFVGPTIVYAFMQACGLINDHMVDCHRHEAVKKLERR
jgi:DNA-3-methyladenine glycosylase I